MNQALAPAASKKRILLVVSDDVRRDLRARVLRKLGADVECAADISEARSLWRADSYNLVLLDVVRDARNAEEFCAEIKAAKPPQAVAFLVGKPDYVAASPRSDGAATSGDINGHGAWGEVVASLFASACEGLSRRWGFQEAAWRIAAARSVKDPSRNYAKLSARTHANRQFRPGLRPSLSIRLLLLLLRPPHQCQCFCAITPQQQQNLIYVWRK
jgi:CheY-like chemotaxis protein